MTGVASAPIKVAIATPTITKPLPAYLDAMEASVPVLEAAGYEVKLVLEVGNPYISAARATMLRKAMNWPADIVAFIDHDLSWPPEDLLALVQAQGDVVAGTYRFKKAEEEYMGSWACDPNGRPLVRPDGNLVGCRIPAGFLKITKEGVDRFMQAYPDLCYGPRYNLSIDLFNHGARDGVWVGEDYAFSRRWLDLGGEIPIIPELQLDHHSATECFPGNVHQFLMRQPGGALDPARSAEA